MPSERKKLDKNKNNSKNTRMDITKSLNNFDLRKDELMHIARYFRAVSTILHLSNTLKRPIRVLDIGCGEAYTMQLLYKAIVKKKSDIIEKYIGIDIDEPMLERVRSDRANMLSVVNGRLIARDLTVNPKLKLKTASYDLVICFEMLEHIKPEFVDPILEEISRVLSGSGVALISTPNKDGAVTDKLPVDHVYEWGYDELREALERHFFVVSTHGMGVNPTMIPKEDKKRLKTQFEALEGAYGKGSYLTTTVMGAFCDPAYCKNVLWVLEAIPF